MNSKKDVEKVSANKQSVSRIRETKEDKEIEKVDDASVVLMVFISILCLVIGVGVMYLLYLMSVNKL